LHQASGASRTVGNAGSRLEPDSAQINKVRSILNSMASGEEEEGDELFGLFEVSAKFLARSGDAVRKGLRPYTGEP